MTKIKKRKKNSFTLLEIIIVVTIIAVIAIIVFVAVNPEKRFADARNSKRWQGIESILDAVNLYTVDNKQAIPGIDGSLKMIGTATSGCRVACANQIAVGEFKLENGSYAFHSLVNTAYANEEKKENIKIDENKPIIISAKSTPVKVVPGDIMDIEAEIKDSAGINKVQAEIGGIETIELVLSSGTIYNGIWKGKWKVHDTENKRYITEITAVDKNNLFSQETISWEDPPGIGWTLPDNYADPGNQWSSETLAYDNNTATYASNNFAQAGLGQFIEFIFNQPVNSDRVRVFADYLNAHINYVDIDLKVNGVWENLFQGGNEATWNCQWVEIPFTKKLIEGARFRYNYKTGGYFYWLYEFQFFKAANTIVPPVCATNNASFITESTALLGINLTDDGGEQAQVQFQYGLNTIYGQTTGWLPGKLSGDIVNQQIVGLSGNTTYYFQGQVKNSAGTTNCGDKQFTTIKTDSGWTLPLGATDPNNTWSDKNLAYDNNINTAGREYHYMNALQWGNFLYFNNTSTLSDKIKFYARGGQDVNSIDIDLFLNGTWTHLYEGPFADKQWVEKTFPAAPITQARIRFYATYISNGFSWELFEFQIWKINSSADVPETQDACLNLTSYLTPKYLTSIPYDPQLGSSARTYYAIKKENDNRKITLVACSPERSAAIKLTK